MKISFLCGSFEPGRDGVADYIGRLATSLAGHGHRSQVIALADRYVPAVSVSHDPGSAADVVRVPYAHWQTGDTAQAEAAIERFSPDWVSLQMVCYAYDPRGLLLGFAPAFARLRGHGRRHLMFHELWIGDAQGFRMRQRIQGWFQRHALLHLARRWQSDVTHTSNPLYRDMLQGSGVHADVLPLFGNIPVCSVDRGAARRALLERLGCECLQDETALLAGVFGSVHPQWAGDAWLERLHARCAEQRRPLAVVHMGRAAERGRELLAGLRRRFENRVAVMELGELPAPELSVLLQGLDFGIATSPWSVIGKSGTVAAMLEHGLPVIVTRNDGQLRNGPTSEPEAHPLLHRFDAQVCEKLVDGRIGPVRTPAPIDVAAAFIAALDRPVIRRHFTPGLVASPLDRAS